MQRIALCALVFVASAMLTSSATSQIITAQPARTVTPSPDSSAAYLPASIAAYAAPAVQSREAQTIRAWYRDYLGRDAGADLTALVNLLRGGMSPTDLQATILGSDEFYRQKGRDPQLFVRDTLEAVTWSEPSYDEVQRWTDRLTQLRGDRFALSREILLANSPEAETGTNIADLATRLAAAARLTIETIEFEIGGTSQGRQAHLQAMALQSAIGQLQSAGAGSLRSSNVRTRLASVESAHQALQTTLGNPPGTAPSAAGIVRRIGTMLSEARASQGGVLTSLPPPPAESTSPGGVDVATLLQQISSARRATESLIQALTSQAYDDYTYGVVLRDLDTLASRLTSLESVVRSGAALTRIGADVHAVGDSAERVRAQLSAGRMPYMTRMYWQSVESSLAQIQETAGIADDPTTMLRPTSFHESLLPLVDQAAAQLDVFLAGTTPLVYSVADVPSVQVDARNLKNRVLLLRQQAGNGQPASVLRQTLAGMVGDYKSAFDRWNRIVADRRLTNPAQLSPVGETLNRVEALIQQALASGELTPSGPSHASQLIVQIGAEASEARRGLAALAGYREQPSLDLYLEQLTGYTQQISDSLAAQTSADARRLAAGMQGVIGRMQTDIDSLNQRVAGQASSPVRERAVELQYRATRIGRLADEMEAQLY